MHPAMPAILLRLDNSSPDRPTAHYNHTHAPVRFAHPHQPVFGLDFAQFHAWVRAGPDEFYRLHKSALNAVVDRQMYRWLLP